MPRIPNTHDPERSLAAARSAMQTTQVEIMRAEDEFFAGHGVQALDHAMAAHYFLADAIAHSVYATTSDPSTMPPDDDSAAWDVEYAGMTLADLKRRLDQMRAMVFDAMGDA